MLSCTCAWLKPVPITNTKAIAVKWVRTARFKVPFIVDDPLQKGPLRATDCSTRTGCWQLPSFYFVSYKRLHCQGGCYRLSRPWATSDPLFERKVGIDQPGIRIIQTIALSQLSLQTIAPRATLA